MPDAATRATAERFTGAPWLLWATAMMLVVTSTNNVVVLGAVALGCWVALWAIGGPRSVVSRVVVGGSLLLAAVWALLGLGIHRPGAGGQVVWLLPVWETETGGEFGGAVTVGQLHLAAAQGTQALAVTAIAGLLLVSVSAQQWLRLAAATWGRAARVIGPLLCLGQACAAERLAAQHSRRAGFPGPGATARLVEVSERARVISEDWFARTSARPSQLRAVIGLVAGLGICLWWAVTAIDPEAGPDVTGMERTLIALAAFTVLGLLLHGLAFPRPTGADLMPVVAAAVVMGCWTMRGRTGDAESLLVDFADLPPLPLALLLSLAALPVLALAATTTPEGVSRR